MTVGELIKKLAQYDLDQTVFLASLSDDSGDSDQILTEEDIDDVDGYIVIAHSQASMSEDKQLGNEADTAAGGIDEWCDSCGKVTRWVNGECINYTERKRK